MTQRSSTAQVPVLDLSHRAEAERLLRGAGHELAITQAAVRATLAVADATLAQADAIDRLAAVLEGWRDQSYEVKKCMTNAGYSIKPKSS